MVTDGRGTTPNARCAAQDEAYRSRPLRFNEVRMWDRRRSGEDTETVMKCPGRPVTRLWGRTGARMVGSVWRRRGPDPTYVFDATGMSGGEKSPEEKKRRSEFKSPGKDGKAPETGRQAVGARRQELELAGGVSRAAGFNLRGRHENDTRHVSSPTGSPIVPEGRYELDVQEKIHCS